MKISIVIPTYNRREVLLRTLPTVLEQDYPPEGYEVVIVVDGAVDGTEEMLRKLVPKAKCALHVLTQMNRGRAAARNTGWKAARGNLILFLDDDLVCDRSLVQGHVSAHDGSTALVVFGPVTVSPESPCTLAVEAIRRTREATRRRRESNADPQLPDDACAGCNTSLPRATLETCGGFDEALSRAEDHELGFRLWKMGARFQYHAEAVAHELLVKSDREMSGPEADSYGKNRVLLCRKHPEFRRHSSLALVADGPRWMRWGREIVTRLPVSLEPALRFPYAVAEKLKTVPAARRAGLRLLQFREAITMYRGAVRQTGSWETLRREFGMRLPTLRYGHVGAARPGTAPQQTVSPAEFERHVRWLAKSGYTGIRPDDWLRWCSAGIELPAKPVLITFDQASSDTAAHALPVLRRYGFGAAAFVATAPIIGNRARKDHGALANPLTAEEIRHWASQGFEFGAHGRTCKDLTVLSASELASEVSGSADDLRNLLGSKSVSFAYPYGKCSEAVLRQTRTAFDLAFTADEGVNHLRTDLHLLRRVAVSAGDSLRSKVSD